MSDFLGGLFGRSEPEEHGNIPVRSERHSGNLLVDGSANGARFTFLLDTGAYDLVFSMSHARALGIASGLDFIGYSKFPDGDGCNKAPVWVDDFRLDGGFRARGGVPAVILERDMPQTLLQMVEGDPTRIVLLGRSVLRHLNFCYLRGQATLSF